MLIAGTCHCKNISFALTWEPEPKEIPARACDCSFCTKHGGVWTSCATGRLEVTVRDPLLVSKYAFGTGISTGTSSSMGGSARRSIGCWQQALESGKARGVPLTTT